MYRRHDVQVVPLEAAVRIPSSEVRDFVGAWNKVMNVDRFDPLAQARSARHRADSR